MSQIIHPVPDRLGDRPLFFLHIPKTAGTTFSNILQQYFASDMIFPAHQWHEFFDAPFEKIASYRLIMGHYNYSLLTLLPQVPHVISFLRDPLERTLSQMEHNSRVSDEEFNMHQPLFVSAENRANLAHLLEVSPSFNNLMCRMLAGPATPAFQAQQRAPEKTEVLERMMENQPQFKTPKNADLLPIAKERLAAMPFFGLTERFDESMQLFAHWLGWPSVTKVTKQRVAQRKVRTDTLEPELYERLVERNQDDIELYNFAQQLFRERHHTMVNKLLNERYQAQAVPIEKDTMVYDLTHVVPGMGWQPLEILPDGQRRWIGPDTTAYLDLPLASGQDVALTIKIMYFVKESQLESLQLAINDQPIAHTPIDENKQITAVVPQALIPEEGYTRLSFSIDEVCSPKSVGLGDDSRPLGLHVGAITIERIQ